MSGFDTQLKVRFGDVDPAGIVYFPKIYGYIHEAFEDLWELHVGARYYQLLQDQQIGFPLVHSEVNFKRPLRFGDRPVVRISCTHLGYSSLGLRYVFRVLDEVCLEATMTVACVDLDGLRPRAVPEEFRSKFELIMEEV